MRGVVADFDEGRGLGTIVADDVTYPFHCTALADGSRNVSPGAAVEFDVQAADQGRWEATRIHRLADRGS